MSATNRKINYSGCKANNSWRSVDSHSRNGEVTVLVSPLPTTAAITLVMHTSDQITVELPYLQDHKSWHSIDAHFDVLSIQYLLPSLIVFIMIWTYWLSLSQIETQPCGKAKCSNIVSLFALKLQKFMYLAKSFIPPAIHLFTNWYSQATAHHSPIIYL